jgi:hypothetical protein
MAHFRQRISANIDNDGFITFKVDVVELDDTEEIVGIPHTEEFKISLDRLNDGCSYVCRPGFVDANISPGTFWLDAEGRRHFIIDAEIGELVLDGKQLV